MKKKKKNNLSSYREGSSISHTKHGIEDIIRSRNKPDQHLRDMRMKIRVLKQIYSQQKSEKSIVPPHLAIRASETFDPKVQRLKRGESGHEAMGFYLMS